MNSFFAISIIVTGALLLFACDNYDKSSQDLFIEAKAYYIEDELYKLKDKEYLDIGSIFDCTDDCSGHEAGFEWAKENDIDERGDCESYNQSFIEGCETYVNELIEITENPEERSGFDDYIQEHYELTGSYQY